MFRSAKFLFVFIALLMIAPVYAQSLATHPPQLLYRKASQLYLADAETGVSKVLPGIETASDADVWKWSLDGRYLLGLIQNSTSSALKIYDVDQMQFLDNLPTIEAPVHKLYSAAWSPDSGEISYSINNAFGTGQLWLLDLAAGKQTVIYQSPHVQGRETGVYDQWWSPSGTYLLYEGFREVMGGTDNSLVLMNRLSGKTVELYDRFFASYDPIWSPDSKWILLTLYDDYSGKPSEAANYIDRGDVFLFNADGGTQFQITHTPEVTENNLHWSVDGQKIQYEIPDNQQVTVTLQDVLNHPNSEIPTQIAPLPPTQNPTLRDFLLSPDGSFIAGIDNSGDYSVLWTEKTDLTDRKNIADLAASATLQNDVIGWRP